MLRAGSHGHHRWGMRRRRLGTGKDHTIVVLHKKRGVIMKVTSEKDLKTLGAQARKKMSDTALRIQVGSCTCGLARRADLLRKALEAEVQKQGLTADIVEVGCNGMCYQEPIVD